MSGYLILLMTLCSGLSTQIHNGTKFMLAFPHHGNSAVPILTMAPVWPIEEDVLTEVKLPDRPSYFFTHAFEASGSYFEPWVLQLRSSVHLPISTTVSGYVIEISANKEIIVQAKTENLVNYSSVGSFTVLPMTLLSNLYIIATSCTTAGLNCFIVIVNGDEANDVGVDFKLRFNNASDDKNQTVEVNGMSYGHGMRGIIYLREYQAIELVASETDMTGTVISSILPVAIFTGGYYSDEKDSQTVCKKDIHVEQIPPYKSLGQSHALVPFVDSPTTTFVKVVLVYSKTFFYMYNKTAFRQIETTENYILFAIEGNEAVFIWTSNRVLVVQYMVHNLPVPSSFCVTAAVVVNPTEQWRSASAIVPSGEDTVIISVVGSGWCFADDGDDSNVTRINPTGSFYTYRNYIYKGNNLSFVNSIASCDGMYGYSYNNNSQHRWAATLPSFELPVKSNISVEQGLEHTSLYNSNDEENTGRATSTKSKSNQGIGQTSQINPQTGQGLAHTITTDSTTKNPTDPTAMVNSETEKGITQEITSGSAAKQEEGFAPLNYSTNREEDTGHTTLANWIVSDQIKTSDETSRDESKYGTSTSTKSVQETSQEYTTGKVQHVSKIELSTSSDTNTNSFPLSTTPYSNEKQNVSTSQTTESTFLSLRQSKFKTATNKQCPCSCNSKGNSNIADSAENNSTKAELEKIEKNLTQEIITELLVRKENLSNVARRYSSAPDKRVSSTVIGFSFSLVLASVLFTIIIVSDMLRIVNFVYNLFRPSQ